MPAPARPKAPALCACGCGEALPLIRRADKLYINPTHWERAHPEKRRAWDRKRQDTPEYRAWLRVWMRAWRKANPERLREHGRRYREKHKAQIAAAKREWERRKAARLAARPKNFTPGLDGLSIVTKGGRCSDWRQDAEQDRVLAELEAAAGRR